MSFSAMVFMGTSVFLVTALAAWCYYKVLTGPKHR